MSSVMPVKMLGPWPDRCDFLWVSGCRDLSWSPQELGPDPDLGSGTLGSETTKASLASRQQEGSCGQEARGPLGSRAWELSPSELIDSCSV